MSMTVQATVALHLIVMPKAQSGTMSTYLCSVGSLDWIVIYALIVR